MSERVTVIFNPMSGSVDDDTRDELQESLADWQVPYELKEITPERSGADIAREAIAAGCRHVLASGGDGTLMSVANGVLKSGEDVLLSVSPGGTANLIAAALGIPPDVKTALATAMNGRQVAIDVCRCGDNYFLLGLGVGIAEKLISETPEAAKEKIGRIAYAWGVLKEIGSRPQVYHFRSPQGEATVRAVGLVVANVGGIGQTIKFAPDARIDDGLIDVCVLHRFNLWDGLRLAVRAVAGGLREDRALSYYQWPSAEILSPKGKPVQIDGDEVDLRTPLEVKVEPRRLRITVPAEGS